MNFPAPLKRFFMRFGWATPNDLYSLGIQLQLIIKDMTSSIQTFAAAQSAFNTKLAADLDSLQADVSALNDKITALQNSQGTLSAEDQKALDDLQTAGQALQDKADALVETDTPVIPPDASKAS